MTKIARASQRSVLNAEVNLAQFDKTTGPVEELRVAHIQERESELGFSEQDERQSGRFLWTLSSRPESTLELNIERTTEEQEIDGNTQFRPCMIYPGTS